MVFVVPKKLTVEESTYGRRDSEWSIVDRNGHLQLQQNRGKIYRIVVTEFYSHYVVAESRYLSDILRQWSYVKKNFHVNRPALDPNRSHEADDQSEYVIKKWYKSQITRLALIECNGSSGAKPPPRWILDKETNACMRCMRPFTMMRRRHHCIFCGKIFCDRCSPRTSFRNKSTHKIVTRQRSCDTCLTAFRATSIADGRFFVRSRAGPHTPAAESGSEEESARQRSKTLRGSGRVSALTVEKCTLTTVTVRWEGVLGGIYDIQHSVDSYWASWETHRVDLSSSSSSSLSTTTVGRFVIRGLQPRTSYLVRIADAVSKGRHHTWSRQIRFKTIESARSREIASSEDTAADDDGAERLKAESPSLPPNLDHFASAPTTRIRLHNIRRHATSSSVASSSPAPSPSVVDCDGTDGEDRTKTNGRAFVTYTRRASSPSSTTPHIASSAPLSVTVRREYQSNKDARTEPIVDTKSTVLLHDSGGMTSCGDESAGHFDNTTETDTTAAEEEEDNAGQTDDDYAMIETRFRALDWTIPFIKDAYRIFTPVLVGFLVWPISRLFFDCVERNAHEIVDTTISIVARTLGIAREDAFAVLCLATMLCNMLLLRASIGCCCSTRRREVAAKGGVKSRRRRLRLDPSYEADSEVSLDSSDDDVTVATKSQDAATSTFAPLSSRLKTAAAVTSAAARWRRRSKSRSLGSCEFIAELAKDGRLNSLMSSATDFYGKLQARLSPGVPKMLPHAAHFRINEDTRPLPFETPLFRGRAVVRIRGADGAPTTRYFEGKRRMFSIQVEGRFLRRIRGDSVIFGAAFDHPVVLPYGTSLGLSLLHRIDPAVQEDLQGPQPWAMSPLLCAMSRIGVRYAPKRRRSTSSSSSLDNNIEDKFFGPWAYGGLDRLEEDSALLLPAAERRRLRSKLPWDSDARRRYFQKQKRREQVWFDPKYVYGFEFMSSRIDLTTYNVSLAIHINMARYLNGQPLRFEARASGGMMPSREALWSVEFPHKDLLRNGKRTPLKED